VFKTGNYGEMLVSSLVCVWDLGWLICGVILVDVAGDGDGHGRIRLFGEDIALNSRCYFSFAEHVPE
jgi:hypothetical protein